jgi:hypothetical protein
LRGVRPGRPLQHGDVLEAVEVTNTDDAFADDEDLVAANVFLSTVLILSSTCDIEHREKILVAPIIPIDDIEDPARADATRQDKVYHRFFLPGFRAARPDGEVILPDSFAELGFMNSVQRDRVSLRLRINSLTERAQNLLKAKLSTFLTRPEPRA